MEGRRGEREGGQGDIYHKFYMNSKEKGQFGGMEKITSICMYLIDVFHKEYLILGRNRLDWSSA